MSAQDFSGFFGRGEDAERKMSQWDAEQAAAREAEERRRDSMPRTPESAKLRARIAQERQEWTDHVESGTVEREARWHEWLLEARRIEAGAAETADVIAYLTAVTEARAKMATALDVLAEADAALAEADAEAVLAAEQVRENERAAADAGRLLEQRGNDKKVASRKVAAETSLPHLRRRVEVCEATAKTRRESKDAALNAAQEVYRAQVRRLGLEALDGVDLPPGLLAQRPSASQIVKDRAVAEYRRAEAARPLAERVLGIRPGVL